MVRSQGVHGLTIGMLAKAAGVGVETIRFYQRRGLLEVPERAGAGGGKGSIRRYGDGDLRRLRFIRSGQSAGFTLDQIAELLALDATDDRDRARELANERIAVLDARIAQLKAARESLLRLAGECAGGPAGPCPILTSFERSSGSDHGSR